MNSERSQSYGRVMDTIRAVGPTKLQHEEQEVIRDAADALLFCDDLQAAPAARDAIEKATAMLRHLVEIDRWIPESADALLADLQDCGPRVPASA